MRGARGRIISSVLTIAVLAMLALSGGTIAVSVFMDPIAGTTTGQSATIRANLTLSDNEFIQPNATSILTITLPDGSSFSCQLPIDIFDGIVVCSGGLQIMVNSSSPQGWSFYFGYGFGNDGNGNFSHTSLDYNIVWSVPQDFPAGDYVAQINVSSSGMYFSSQVQEFPVSSPAPCEYAPDEGTLALYHANEGSGTTVADAAGSYDASLTGSWTADSKFGPGALDFSKKSQMASQQTLLDAMPGQGTIEFWFMPKAPIIYGSPQQVFIYKKNVRSYGMASSPDQSYLMISASRTGRPGQICFEMGDFVKTVCTSQDSWTIQWYHVAATWGPLGMKLYINGVEKASRKYTGSIPDGSNTDFIIGNTFEGSNPFKGYMDEIRVSDVQRTTFTIC